MEERLFKVKTTRTVEELPQPDAGKIPCGDCRCTTCNRIIARAQEIEEKDKLTPEEAMAKAIEEYELEKKGEAEAEPDKEAEADVEVAPDAEATPEIETMPEDEPGEPDPEKRAA